MWPRRKEGGGGGEEGEGEMLSAQEPPTPHCDMVISRKQLAKWGDGVCASPSKQLTQPENPAEAEFTAAIMWQQTMVVRGE